MVNLSGDTRTTFVSIQAPPTVVPNSQASDSIVVDTMLDPITDAQVTTTPESDQQSLSSPCDHDTPSPPSPQPQQCYPTQVRQVQDRMTVSFAFVSCVPT